MLIGRGLPTNFFFFQYFTKITLLLNFHQDLLKTTLVGYATHFGDYNDGMDGKRTLDKRKMC